MIKENSQEKIQVQDYKSSFEVAGAKVIIEAKKGWMKDLTTMKKLDPLYFYGYSENTANVKVPFELETLEAG